MPRHSSRIYLEDIRTAIRLIEKYSTGYAAENFFEDSKTTDAVIRNLEIIGEAVSKLPRELLKRFPEIPWRSIIDMRNKLIHEYAGIDFRILSETVTHDLPPLKKCITHLLKEIS